MNIDGSGARKGAGEFTAAINKIAAATKALDKSMSSVSTSVAKTSNFRQIAKDLAALNSASVNPALAKNLTALGAALQAMKAPSATSIKNTRAFLREVERASVNAGVVKSLAAFSQAMASYKGPNAASAKNTRDFFRALSTATINSGLASSMAKFASAMAGYKGPNAAAAKNTQAFFTALATARINPALGSSLEGSLLNGRGLDGSGRRRGGRWDRLGVDRMHSHVRPCCLDGFSFGHRLEVAE